MLGARALPGPRSQAPALRPAGREPACSLERDHRPRLRARGLAGAPPGPQGRAVAGAFPRGGPGLSKGFSQLSPAVSSAGGKAAQAEGRPLRSDPTRGSRDTPPSRARGSLQARIPNEGAPRVGFLELFFFFSFFCIFFSF